MPAEMNLERLFIPQITTYPQSTKPISQSTTHPDLSTQEGRDKLAEAFTHVNAPEDFQEQFKDLLAADSSADRARSAFGRWNTQRIADEEAAMPPSGIRPPDDTTPPNESTPGGAHGVRNPPGGGGGGTGQTNPPPDTSGRRVTLEGRDRLIPPTDTPGAGGSGQTDPPTNTPGNGVVPGDTGGTAPGNTPTDPPPPVEPKPPLSKEPLLSNLLLELTKNFNPESGQMIALQLPGHFLQPIFKLGTGESLAAIINAPNPPW